MNTTKHCRYGPITYRTNDLFIGRSFDLYGEFSEGEVELFRQIVRPGQTVLDVGANIGAHTVPLAQLVGPAGRVLAFEPQRTIYYTLCANVVQNNLETIVQCFRSAVGERPGTIAVPDLKPDAEQNFGGLSLVGTAWPDAEKVSVLRIDDLPLAACHLSKIDVEGMEREVLLGARQTILRFRPLLYVEDDRKDKSAALRSLLSSLGYELYAHAPLLFNPRNFLNNANNVFGNIVSANLYACPDRATSPIRPEDLGMRRVNVDMPAKSGRPPSAQTEQLAREQLNQGLAFYQGSRWEEARAAFRRAAEINPDLAEAYHNLGLVDAAQGHFQKAMAAYRQALVLKPGFAQAHHNLALAQHQSGQLAAAIESGREAVARAPDWTEARSNLGRFLQEAGNYEESSEVLKKALALDTADPRAYTNLGNVLRDKGDLDEALDCYEQAVQLKPDDAAPHWNRSLIWLSRGDFERGWDEYQWRWKLSTFPRRNYPEPLWDGAALDGKTILLMTEQGLGDTLQFVRYAALLAKRGARVVVEAHPALCRLLKTCPGVDQVIAFGEPPPPFDTHVNLMDLPRFFAARLGNIPADAPYLSPNTALVENWRDEIRSLAGIKIGIAWNGVPQNALDRERALPLAMFEPLAGLPDVTLVSLQQDAGVEQIAEVANRFKVIDVASRLDETAGPLMAMAAVMKHMDLLIVCDSVVAHLAGAMGVPVWLALTKTPNWRWLLDRDDSPWYPTMRLFRQQRRGDWTDVFDKLARALSELQRSS